MLEKLEGIYNRWISIQEQMNDPAVINDMDKYIKLNKDYKDLQPIVDAYKEYKNVTENITSTKEVLKNEKDEDFREMAKEELDTLVKRKEELDEEMVRR